MLARLRSSIISNVAPITLNLGNSGYAIEDIYGTEASYEDLLFRAESLPNNFREAEYGDPSYLERWATLRGIPSQDLQSGIVPEPSKVGLILAAGIPLFFRKKRP